MSRIALLVALLVAGTAGAQTPEDCAALEDLKVEDTNLLSSALVPATDDLPAYCRVLGYVRPAINFEIRLPPQDWNGKFYMAGCGSRCGKLESDRPGFTNAMNHGLRRNYAAATMDGGHWSPGRSDSLWAYNNPVARFDYDQRAVPETARVSKELIKAYYGIAPEKSYFAGCSNGGRQANMEAWRYPEDFDGIISGCPTLHSEDNRIAWAWNVKANTGPDGKNVLTFAKLPLIAEAVYAACASDGGLIDDPWRCRFEPKDLQCRGVDNPECLTAAEVEVLEKWYGGPKNSQGEPIYPGVPLGSEPYWSLWLAGEDEASWRADKETLQDFLLYYGGFAEDLGSEYDVVGFDFDKDPERLRAAIGPHQDADGTDLSAFKERGGKLLVYQGLADAGVPPEATRQWYEALSKDMGGEAATLEFARLFLVPGMDHCGVLSGPGVHHSGFDPLPAIEKWVEEGTPPESIVMTKTDEADQSEWTRPVCAYPEVAKYGGTGDINDAASWACRAP